MHVKLVESDSEWEAARQVRRTVFIDEQNCPPDEEWDAHDAHSRHLIGIEDDTVIATARWRVVDHDGTAVAKLERFAVLESYRGQGHGRTMVQATLADARRAGFRAFMLHAQAHLESFYAAFGFRSTGHRFEEVGIPHVEMLKTLAPEDAAPPA